MDKLGVVLVQLRDLLERSRAEDDEQLVRLRQRRLELAIATSAIDVARMLEAVLECEPILPAGIDAKDQGATSSEWPARPGSSEWPRGLFRTVSGWTLRAVVVVVG